MRTPSALCLVVASTTLALAGRERLIGREDWSLDLEYRFDGFSVIVRDDGQAAGQ